MSATSIVLVKLSPFPNPATPRFCILSFIRDPKAPNFLVNFPPLRRGAEPAGPGQGRTAQEIRGCGLPPDPDRGQLALPGKLATVEPETQYVTFCRIGPERLMARGDLFWVAFEEYPVSLCHTVSERDRGSRDFRFHFTS